MPKTEHMLDWGKTAAEIGDDFTRMALERDMLRDALEWYADSANWKRMKGRDDMGPKSWSRSAAMIDRGARAKFLLTQLTPNAGVTGLAPEGDKS